MTNHDSSLCIQAVSSMDEDGEARRLGEVAGTYVDVYCTRAASCETNLASYRTQKAADSWIADSVFVMQSDFSMHLLFV